MYWIQYWFTEVLYIFNTFMCPNIFQKYIVFFLHQMTLFHLLDFVGAVVLRALSTQIKSSAVAQLKKLCVCVCVFKTSLSISSQHYT